MALGTGADAIQVTQFALGPRSRKSTVPKGTAFVVTSIIWGASTTHSTEVCGPPYGCTRMKLCPVVRSCTARPTSRATS